MSKIDEIKNKVKRSHAAKEFLPYDNVNDNENVDINNNANDNVNDNININVNVNDSDYVDQLIQGKKKKDNDLVLKGIYFPREVAKEIDRLSKNGGKGAQSRLVTEAVVKLFKEKGIL